MCTDPTTHTWVPQQKGGRDQQANTKPPELGDLKSTPPTTKILPSSRHGTVVSDVKSVSDITSEGEMAVPMVSKSYSSVGFTLASNAMAPTAANIMFEGSPGEQCTNKKLVTEHIRGGVGFKVVDLERRRYEDEFPELVNSKCACGMPVTTTPRIVRHCAIARRQWPRRPLACYVRYAGYYCPRIVRHCACSSSRTP